MKMLPLLPVKKFDDRPAHDLLLDEICSLKREKILSGKLMQVKLEFKFVIFFNLASEL